MSMIVLWIYDEQHCEYQLSEAWYAFVIVSSIASMLDNGRLQKPTSLLTVPSSKEIFTKFSPNFNQVLKKYTIVPETRTLPLMETSSTWALVQGCYSIVPVSATRRNILKSPKTLYLHTCKNNQGLRLCFVQAVHSHQVHRARGGGLMGYNT